jgi:hypothetical protein
LPSVRCVLARLPVIEQALRERYLDGLRKAGLPD